MRQRWQMAVVRGPVLFLEAIVVVVVAVDKEESELECGFCGVFFFFV